MKLCCHDSVGTLIHTLHSVQIFAEVGFYLWNTIYDIFIVVCLENHQSSNFIHFRTVNVELSDDSQSSLASDKQLLEVIASVVLQNLRTEVYHLPVWQHCLKTQNMRAERTVLYHILSARICGRISSNLTGPLGSQI